MAEQVKSSLPVPFLIPTLAWCVGIIIASLYHIAIPWLVAAVVVFFVAGVVFKYKLPILTLLFITAGCLRLTIAVQEHPSSFVQVLSGKQSITQSCSGEIVKVINSANNSYLIRLDNVHGIAVNEKAVMYFRKKELTPGDRFKAIAGITLRKADAVLDDYSLYNRMRYKQEAILLSPVYKLENLPGDRVFSFEWLRYKMLKSIDAGFTDYAPFAKALLLNDRTADRDWLQQLIQGGLLHLIAISGLHVLLFYFLFVTLLNIFLPRRVSEVIFLLLMLMYAGLCQWSAPIMRAILMILLYVISRFMQRKVSPLQIICLSLFIITLVDPVQLFSVGLQLSYLCVLVLAYVIPGRKPDNVNLPLWKRKLSKAGYYLIDMVIVSVILTLVLLPLTMFYFQRGSFNGIIGNLLGIPFMSLLLPLTLILVLIPAHLIVFQWLKASFDVIYLLFQKWVVWTAGLPFYVDTVNLSLSGLIVLYLVIIAIIIRWKSGLTYRKLTYALLILAICTAAYAQFPHKKSFCITVFNAGLGDCSLIEYPGGQTVMIDTGPKSYNGNNSGSGWFGYKARHVMKRKNITTIDLLVLSHLDEDHRGGLSDVLHNLKVRNIVINRHDAGSELWRHLTQNIDMKEAKLTVISDTLSILFAGSKLTFLHPDTNYHSDNENDNSLVLRVDYKGYSALFPGDISAETELYLTEHYPDQLDCDFLKVPHHGSKYSSSSAFIKAVSPARAIITAPLQNRFHFPDKVIMKRFRDYGIEPQLTGNGSVVINIP